MDHSLLPNIDLQEIANFDALVAGWRDLRGDLKALHVINPLRLEYNLR